MRSEALLTLLEGRGVRLASRDGQLLCKAPRGVLTAELRGHIGRLKPELLALLDARQRRARRPQLSPSQLRIRDLARLLPAASPAGNIPLGFTVRGPLAIDGLTRALNAVVAGHPVFATVCADGEARLDSDARAAVEQVDLRARPQALAAEQRRRVIEPFDLTRAPLLRATVFRVDDETHVLLLLTHVFAFDGRSTPLLIAALSAALGGQPTATPAVYADLARTMHGATDPGPSAAFWRAALAGVELLCPLTNAPGAAAAPAGHVPVALSPATSAAITALARTCRATVFHTVMAGFQTALHRLSGQPSLAVGTIVSYRRGIAAEGTIGSFAHNMLFPARFTDGLTFRALVEAQRDHARRAMGHLHLPIEAVLADLEPAQRRRRPYDVMCVLHHVAGGPTLDVPHLDVKPHPIEKPLTAHALDLVLAERGGQLRGALGYDADRITPDAAAGVVRALVQVLESAAADPDCVIGAPRSPAAPGPSTPCDGEPPRTALEASIADLWARLLDRPVVPRDADFYTLGGHSLLALTMLSHLEAQHGRLPPDVHPRFAAAPTVATLAQAYTP